MKNRRGKHKRGKRGSTEDEVNSAKKPNMEAADCTNNSDSEVKESVVNFAKQCLNKNQVLMIKICVHVFKPRLKILNTKTERCYWTSLLRTQIHTPFTIMYTLSKNESIREVKKISRFLSNGTSNPAI